MIFAEFRCHFNLGAGFLGHPLSPPQNGKTVSLFAPCAARVSFGDPTARKWPDSIELVGGQAFLFSERIVEQILALQPRGIEFLPVEIGRISSAVLERKRPPTYLWARISGEMGARILKDGVELAPDQESGRVKLAPIDYLRSKITMQLDPSNWDGSDFFAISNLGHGMRLCSERIIEAGSRYQWRDIIFARTNANLSMRL